MLSLKESKKSIITIFVVIVGLLVIMAVGFTVGILSSDPDGLERVLIDAGVEEPAEIFTPLLAWIENDFIIAILGIGMTAAIITATYYTLGYIKKRRM